MKPEELLEKLKKLRDRKNYDILLSEQKLYVRSCACGEVIGYCITNDDQIVEDANKDLQNDVKKFTCPDLAAEYLARDFNGYLYADMDGIIGHLQDCIDGRDTPYLRAIERFFKEQAEELDCFDNRRLRLF